MALFMKQDFTPPMLSRRWFAIKLRPNMLLYNREHIISILESGLMFREDSVEVEQEAPEAEAVWAAAGGGRGGWLTRGERVAAATAVVACVLAFPPRSLKRSTLIHCAAYASIPLSIRAVHRRLCRGSLGPLLTLMREYLALARRAAACLKEYRALHAHIGSMTSVIESMHMLLCRQQSEMAIVMSRASSAVLGNAPWLRGDVVWEAVPRNEDSDNLMKIHHAFLVVQSTLLKHIAMAHYIPSLHAQKIYKNHNERIYWIHNTLIEHLYEEFKQNFDSLERMYRLLKNSGSKDDVSKKFGSAMNDSWLYSEVHTGIAKSCLELKLALNKSNGLDMFLDSCAMNKQDLDVDVLSKDVDDLIDVITKCLTTVQNSQIRLKKIKSKFGIREVNGDVVLSKVIVNDDDDDMIRIDDHEPEPKDEVFYFVRTDDDDERQQAVSDLTTRPGRREKENTKIVMCELKRKLGKREDFMRERERQALAKTMPEFKDGIPEFPRQIQIDEFVERRGYIKKINNNKSKDKLFRNYKIKRSKPNNDIYKLSYNTYVIQDDIVGEVYEANARLNLKSKLVTISPSNKNVMITKWCKTSKLSESGSNLSDSLSDIQPTRSNEFGIKFSKNELELTPSSSDNEFDYCARNELLKDVRKNRVARKKHYRSSIDKDMDESLKPIEYSFGTGLAMASVLQVNSKVPNMSHEEVFIGDGEVSDDSGNDEDS